MKHKQTNENKNDIRVGWESLVSCPGACAGCNISRAKDNTGIWNDEQYALAKEQTIALMKQYMAENSGKDLSAKIFLTAGDYLMLSDEQLISVFENVNSAMPKEIKERVVVFSTSAIAKPSELTKRIDLIQKFSIENDLIVFPEIVMDFAKLRFTKYWKNYIENIKLISCAFPITEVIVQVGHDTFDYGITFDDIKSLIKESNLAVFEFALTPNVDSARLLKPKWGKTIDFISEFYDYWKPIEKTEISFCHYPIPKIISDKHKEINKAESPYSLSSILEYGKNSCDYYSVYIKNNGDISSFLSGMTNVYPTSYTDNKSYVIKNLFNSRDVSGIDLNRLLEKTYKTSFMTISRFDECSSCEFRNLCSVSGVAMLLDNMDVKSQDVVQGQCPINIKKYLAKVTKPEVYSDNYCEVMAEVNLDYKEGVR